MNPDVPNAYLDLVRSRKECRRCELCEAKLVNPAIIDGGIYDSDHVGPWSSWHGKFRPELMVVGQDWGDTKYFKEQLGKDKHNNPTNEMLCHLVRFAGFDMDSTFLTNAILCLKEGGLQARVYKNWFSNCEPFLKRTIEIVEPRILITLGQRAYRSIEVIFSLPTFPKFRQAVDSGEILGLPNGIRFFPVYHCGSRTQKINRSRSQQEADWRRIGQAVLRADA